MNKKEKMSLVPKLRFPEFLNTVEWKVSELGTIFYNRQESGFVSLPLMSLTDEFGIIPQADTNKKDNSNSDKSKYLRICIGDIVYNTMRMWQGRCAYANVEGIVSPAYTVCTPQKENNGLFFYYYFKTYNMIKKFHANSQGLVNDTLNLKYDAFSRIIIAYPSVAEQQKIAYCLSSLDELITEEDKKLEALKAHKKGLMQKIFPAEGKTVPEWRFFEFRGKEEWENKKLLDICKMQAGNFVSTTEIDDKQISTLFPCYGGNGLRGYTKTFTHSGRYPLIGRQGALCGNVTFVGGKFHATEHAIVCTPSQEIIVDWLYFQLVMMNLNQYATGQAQPGLSVKVLEKIPVKVPTTKAEQQRIADCLTSIDDGITAQVKKIEALKVHKKGLMQGLFPSLEEVGK